MKNIIKEAELIVFDVNFNVEVNLNNSEILFIDEDLNIKSRRFTANDINYKTL